MSGFSLWRCLVRGAPRRSVDSPGVRRSLVTAALLPVLGVAVGCGIGETTVGLDERSASIGVGDRLVIDLGGENPSVGYVWHVVDGPDERVLADREKDVEFEGGGPGSGGEAFWRFEGIESGETTVTFQRCYRSRPPDCERGPLTSVKPVEFTITVR